MEFAKRILVPLDFSECSRVALERAVALAAAVGASVEVLHVAETPAMVSPDLMVTIPNQPSQTITQWVLQEAEKGVNRVLAELKRPPNVAIEHRIVVGHTAEEIVTAAREGHADVVVMGTHGRRGLSHLVLGSIAEKVIRAAPCPVLTVRAPEV
jgi:nucleotide-binding universal stress UspA family protein